jgi:hypothetical protein
MSTISGFKIQRTLPEKHGCLKKKGKLLGRQVVRYYRIEWQDRDTQAVLRYFNNESMSSGGKTISLKQ